MPRTLLKLVGAFLTFITMAAAATVPISRGTSVNDLEAVDMAFTGTIHGVAVQLNGSSAQFSTLYPEVVADHNANNPAVGTLEDYFTWYPVNASVAPRGTGTPLIARNKMQPPLCWPVGNWGWGTTYVDRIQQGISYLNHLGGRIYLDVGARSRISCSYSDAIYANNDNPYPINPATVYLASYAQDLINFCQFQDPNSKFWMVCGQEFDSDNYNVVVRYDSTQGCG
ncbi:uncharacterized protein LY89DRAFT_678133 [Mollisia scopiformis]|uniref:Uncharacterized protein n=1 Tax=Mollisia scopiformis TaxID=149040 RepID=A0A132B670_MOLSC|nr:uncharacterized protein LY89DRAFT_678133 [Mollisia scopiformis]KUJ07167.1 hypothetical protein LY89DRAFT_678133 [Mollisia scopiformis]